VYGEKPEYSEAMSTIANFSKLLSSTKKLEK